MLYRMDSQRYIVQQRPCQFFLLSIQYRCYLGYSPHISSVEYPRPGSFHHLSQFSNPKSVNMSTPDLDKSQDNGKFRIELECSNIWTLNVTLSSKEHTNCSSKYPKTEVPLEHTKVSSRARTLVNTQYKRLNEFQKISKFP